jgi:phage terminase large subunit-like protein
LWKGRWVSGKGDALDEDSINRAFVHNGPELDRRPGWTYVGGLDLGVSRDHSAFVVLGVSVLERRIRLVRWQSWIPKRDTNKVDLEEVRDAVAAAFQLYGIVGVWYDPSQAELMAQELSRHVTMRSMAFSPKNLKTMADCLVQTMKARLLECYDNEDQTLRKDFGKLSIEEKQYGHRLTAVRDEDGHADVATALVIALPAAVRLLQGYLDLSNIDLIDLPDVPESADVEQELIKTMPKELQDICEDLPDEGVALKVREPVKKIEADFDLSSWYLDEQE